MIWFSVLAGDDADRDDEEQEREDHDDLDQPRDDGVDPAAEVAGEEAHDDAEPDRADRREQCDLERGLRAVEEAQEEVAAEGAVGAQRQSVVGEVTRCAPGYGAVLMCVHGPTGVE